VKQKDIANLLARNPLIAGACELDLLVFLYRHPRALLTNEQLAAYVGYDMKLIARAIDAFVGAGLLERTQNPMHAARMYLLQLEDPRKGGLKMLLELASSLQGRRDILQILTPMDSRPTGARGRRLRAIA
jgi:DNA-binding MarR family transcriptional regulator